MDSPTEPITEPIEQKTEELIKQAEAVISPVIPTEEQQRIMAMFPPMGTTAPKIARSMAELEKLNPPEAIKNAIYLDEQGNLLPEWAQVARMYNRPIKKVAICGFADSVTAAPFDDPTWEIWGLNDLHARLVTLPNGRFDRWFDIHDLDNINADVKLLRNKGVTPPENIGLDGLSKLNVPVYMQGRTSLVPNSIPYPLKEVINAFPYGKYMTNSISYMIALAIYEGYQEISIYGVDMAVGQALDGEYSHQRPSCEYWAGVAVGRGIKLYIPTASDLLKCSFLYGFESKVENEFDVKMKDTIEGMLKRQAGINEQLNQGQRALWQYEGAVNALREMIKVRSNCGTSLSPNLKTS